MSNASEQALEAHMKEGIAIIRALMAKSDCSVDRNDEFYRAAQWEQLTKDRYLAQLQESRIARYVLCPGYVQSQHDGQSHYVGPMALAKLYGVRLEQCEIYEPAQWWPESYYRMAEERMRGLIKLEPRFNGNYTVPNNP